MEAQISINKEGNMVDNRNRVSSSNTNISINVKCFNKEKSTEQKEVKISKDQKNGKEEKNLNKKQKCELVNLKNKKHSI